MTAELLARLGGPVAAAGLAILLLASVRPARLAGLGIWALGMALFLPFLAPSGNRFAFAAGAVAASVVCVLLALLFRWKPWSLPLLTLAAVPARFPVTVGDESANLLVPLYAVVAGAAVALGWSLWRNEPRRRELGALSWPLALLVLWLGLSALWTDDPREAAVDLFFFALPFPLLALVLARLPWSELALTWLGRLLLAMALLFAVVGIWQWTTREVFWNPNVIADNAFAPFYRVNSLFWDPSIYGRFLVVTILVALVFLLFGTWRRFDLPLFLTIGALWVGLLFSFSQSSFFALAAGVVLAAALAWKWRAVAAVAVVAVLMIPIGFAAPQLEDVRESLLPSSTDDLNRATRGRFQLESTGLRIAADHPVAGVGIGGFEREYKELKVVRRDAEPVSHNVLVTFAAETGFVGLGLFGWLLGAGFVVAFRRTRTGPPIVRVAGLVAGLGLFAVLVHSLFYAGFFEDPLVWCFLALAALAAGEQAERKQHPPSSAATASA